MMSDTEMKPSEIRTHFGDPCIHCGTPHDEIEPGSCHGDFTKAKPTAYASLGVRWDGVEHYRIRFSDGRVEDLWRHISEHAPYWHFGFAKEFQQPPRYDERLKAAHLAKEQEDSNAVLR
jgi:hypothetical protein